MTRQGSELDPELAAFVTSRGIRREMPPELRARVLASARARLGLPVQSAAVPATHATREIPSIRPSSDTPAHPVLRHRLLRLAVAALLLLAGAAAGAAAALHGRRAEAPQGPTVVSLPPPTPTPKAGARGVRRPAAPTELVEVAEPAPEPVKHTGRARSVAKGDPLGAELELLQQAHREFTRHRYPATLALVAKHEQRFPNGQLAEQREALRVRSLASAGRADEAQRATATFALRFPRSVLLPPRQHAQEAAPAPESSPR